jgi:hypothetical protein
MICADCGSILTDEERHYYERRCEKCETAHHDKISAWRRGGDDPELDAVFSVPKPSANYRSDMGFPISEQNQPCKGNEQSDDEVVSPYFG